MIQQGDGQSSNAIIQCCIDACQSRGLSFESIAQERSIQGHTPLYWTIVKIASPSSQPSSSTSPAPTPSTPSTPTPSTSTSIPASDLDASRALSVFDLLLSFPLTPDAYSDAIQACLLTSSHATFQLLLQHNPTPPPVIPGEEIESIPPDAVEVFNGEDVEAAISGAFRVTVKLRDFQKRLRVLKEIGVDFVARGRMWRIKFFIWAQGNEYPKHVDDVKHGNWCVMLDLIENSPDTFLDSRLIVGKRCESLPLSFRLLTLNSSATTLAGSTHPVTPSNPRPMTFRMKSSREYQLSGVYSEKSWGVRSRGPVTHVLSEESNGASLQFE